MDDLIFAISYSISLMGAFMVGRYSGKHNNNPCDKQ